MLNNNFQRPTTYKHITRYDKILRVYDAFLLRIINTPNVYWGGKYLKCIQYTRGYQTVVHVPLVEREKLIGGTQKNFLIRKKKRFL